MVEKTLPFTPGKLDEIIGQFKTPFHIYDEAGIRKTARTLHEAFARVKSSESALGFTNFYAVKALPNPFILEILRDEGMGADCSSLPELLLAQAVGITGNDIMLTSNNTPDELFEEARRLGAIINFDDLTHIERYEQVINPQRLPTPFCCRYNPGSERKGNLIIGDPSGAKYGLTKDQLVRAFQSAKGRSLFYGLHTMVASNEQRPGYFVETARMMFQLISELSESVGIDFDFVNLGGGIGIPYHPTEHEAVDLDMVSRGIQEAYTTIIEGKGLPPLRLMMENGRLVTGPHGYLVTKVRHVMKKHKDFVGVDASIADLMRHAMYSAYHHITPVRKTDQPHDHVYTVVDSLCENNGRFATDRKLPRLERDDLLVIHDTGAHGSAMGFNYNGALRCKELLLREDGTVVQIRRAETVEDLFARLEHPGLDAAVVAYRERHR